jgi:uncharacterized membrane protein YgcG
MTGTRLARAASCRLAGVVLLPLVLFACAPPSPSTGAADDPWRPKGINAANLAAMVEDPADLTRGRSDPAPTLKLGARAVTDLWANPVAPLLSGGGSSGGSSGSSGGGGSSGGQQGGGSSSGAAPSSGTGN